MLIHVTPQLFDKTSTGKIDLIDLSIDELSIFLVGGKDLVARRPYPNKCFQVACRKLGQKAINGILIDTEQRLRSFTLVVRWAVNAESILTHRTNYVVVDDEYDALSDSMVLWYATSHGLGSWKSRWPDGTEKLIPAHAQPRMDVWPSSVTGAERQGDIKDIYSETGMLVERSEIFRIPTIERERILSERAVSNRLPAIGMAFKI